MYQRILVPVDGSSTSAQGLSEAISIAKLTAGRIRLLHVIREPFPAIAIDAALCAAAEIHGLARDAAERIIARATEQVEAQGIAVDSQWLDSFDGRVCDLVVQAAQAWEADLIVIGTHGRRGVGRMLLGSDAEQILRLAPVPVLLVRGTSPTD